MATGMRAAAPGTRPVYTRFEPAAPGTRAAKGGTTAGNPTGTRAVATGMRAAAAGTHAAAARLQNNSSRRSTGFIQDFKQRQKEERQQEIGQQ